MAPHFDTWPTFIGLRNWSSRACPVCVAKSTNPLSLSFYISLCHFSLFVPFYFSCSSPWSSNFSLSLCLLFFRLYPSGKLFLFLDSFPSSHSLSNIGLNINLFAFSSPCSLQFINYRNCSFSLSLSLPLEIFSIKLTDNLITFPFVKKFTRLVYTFLIQITFSFFKVVRHSDEGWASDSSIYIAFNTREDLWVISPFSFACWPKWRAI